MSAEKVTPPPYVPGLGAFLTVLVCVTFAEMLAEPGFPDESLSDVLARLLGRALVYCFVPGLAALLTFWSRDPERGLAGKVILPALLYGMIVGLSMVGRSTGQPDFAGGRMAFIGYTGALVAGLYLVQFIGRWRASRRLAG